MEKYFVFLLQSYVTEVVQMIVEKYNYEPMQALRLFLDSETYRMLSNIDMEMWEFGTPAILDMWENEKITGTVHTSSYLRPEN
ncbi:MAG: hypothetical protein IKD76_03170 [Clostridia bacterium]|nr:hypothetical protein [Clostridia bacterium]